MNRKIGVIYSYVLMFVEVISATLFTPFLIRSLGQSEYGVYQLVYSVTAYLMLLDLGIGNAVIRYMAKYRTENNKKKQEEFLGIATLFYGIIAFIVLIVGAVLLVIFPTAFAKGLTPEEISVGRKLLTVTILSTAVTLGTSSFATTLMAYERFSFSKGLSILFSLLKIIFSLIALLLGMRSLGVVMVHFISNVLTRGAYTVFVLFKLKLKPKFKNPDFGFVKETVSYSAFVLLQMIATQINSMTDSVLLGILAKGSSVIIAVYGAGAQIVQYFKTVASHINSVLMAGVVRLVESGANAKALQNEMVRIGRIVFMMLGMVFTVFLVNGTDFMVLWAGENYRQGYMVAVAIMAPTMFTLVQSIGNQILWAMNKHRTQAVVQIVSALINIVLTAFLIKWNPLIGAVIGSVIALTVGDVLCMNVMFKKEIGISLIGYYMGLFKGILPSLLLSGGAGLLFNLIGLSKFGWLGFIVNCGVMVLVYGICMLIFGMNTSEKRMIFNIFKKIFVKLHLIKGE
ncbi:MAG: lipopolysaccharide biosynthesis protein [Candidatus Fimenecus sp.]